MQHRKWGVSDAGLLAIEWALVGASWLALFGALCLTSPA